MDSLWWWLQIYFPWQQQNPQVSSLQTILFRLRLDSLPRFWGWWTDIAWCREQHVLEEQRQGRQQCLLPSVFQNGQLNRCDGVPFENSHTIDTSNPAFRSRNRSHSGSLPRLSWRVLEDHHRHWWDQTQKAREIMLMMYYPRRGMAQQGVIWLVRRTVILILLLDLLYAL